MGRFLGGSPPSTGDGARRGRRYEALPAATDDEAASASPSPSSSSQGQAATEASSARHNSRSALMESDSELEEDEREQEAQRAEQEEKDDRQHEANNTAATATTSSGTEAAVQASEALNKAEKGKESPEQADGEQAAAEGEAALPEGAIHVRILDLNGKFFNLTCLLDATVASVKSQVLECTEVPVAQQRLIYRGRVLEDASSLAEYKLEDGHTVHLFVRAAPTPDPEILSAELNANGSAASGLRAEDGAGLTIVQLNGETVSSAVFPSDSARRVDPLMLDSPLGNCARRVKLWSSFLLIIYTMKVMGQFALLANDQQMRSQQQQGADGNEGNNGNPPPHPDRYNEYPQYYNPDPLVSGLEMLVHGFGVYVGCVGFKAAHDTDMRPIRFYFRGLIWLALLTIAEQVYITVQIAHSDFPTDRVQYPYGGQGPTKDDIVSANVFQVIMLVLMWLVAIRHSYLHVREVAIYNQSFAAAAMNAMPPVHLPEVV